MTQDTLALLIDGDNASPKVISEILSEIAKYGVASVRRVYGDWTQTTLSGWKATLLKHSLQPVQQFPYTTGKNATDGAMIIDAMDLLYTDRFSGFCIVSSDSDFTRLAARIREQGLIVYGFGERKTPPPFIAACDKFTYFDVLGPLTPVAPPSNAKSTATKPRVNHTKPKLNGQILDMLTQAFEAWEGDDGKANLSNVGNHLRKQAPEFDSRNYGYERLAELVKSTGMFDMEYIGENPKIVMISLRE